ncbi:predicted protein [Coccidioides posadasii str. Silveira]|uniref:Predicted protein n=1 Tax=Coccidioides posadasii (strain RMSCC 757 / Silveira) TaxID=443226 RepID=E9D5I6_COCPS|nr:predicted protein [Coccidioides posadasii str. Silveira]
MNTPQCSLACVDRENVATAQRRILPTDNPDNGQIVQTGAAQGDVMSALSISRAETPPPLIYLDTNQ